MSCVVTTRAAPSNVAFDKRESARAIGSASVKRWVRASNTKTSDAPHFAPDSRSTTTSACPSKFASTISIDASKAIVDLEGNPITEEMLNAIGVEHSKPISASNISLSFRVWENTAPFAAQIDGEELSATDRVTIEVVKRALRLVVPKT